MAKYVKGELSSVRHCYELGLEQATPAIIEEATILVEKIKSPILLVSGTDDQTWPSADFAAAVMQRLENLNHTYEHRHLRLERAGHMSFLPFLIRGNDRFMNGGNARDDTRGGFLAWRESVSFLHKHLDH